VLPPFADPTVLEIRLGSNRMAYVIDNVERRAA
jgi:hypothetical protein